MKNLDVETRNEMDRLFIRSRKLLEEGQTTEALALAEEAWAKLPEPKYDWDVTLSFTHAMAKRYRDAKHFDKALAVMKWLFASGVVEAFEDGPRFITGTIYYDAGNLVEAKKWFSEANKISKGRCFRDEPPKYKEFFTGVKVATTLENDISEKIDELSEQGNDQIDQGQFLEAIQSWQAALNLLPPPVADWEAFTWLSASIGDAYYQLEKYSDALQALLDAHGSDASNPNPFVLYRIGQCYEKLKDIAKASEYLLQSYMMDGSDIFEEDHEGAYYLSLLKRQKMID